MTDSFTHLEKLCPEFQANYDAATYFILEALHETGDTVEFVLLEETEGTGLFGITIGLPDRPALRTIWTFRDFCDATAALQVIRDDRPDARFFFAEWSEEDGIEIKGNDILRGMIVMRATKYRVPDPNDEWTWLMEDMRGNRPSEGRSYEPFYARIAEKIA